MYKNTRQPNLTISGASGWCLSFTQDVWGTPHLYPKAIDAWNASGASNHPNEQPPIEVKTIAYWTYRDPTDGIQYGHIATNVPGQGVYTSPFNRSYGYEWYGSIQSMSDRIKRIDPNSIYLGWSETLSKVQLVKEQDMTALADKTILTKLWVGYAAQYPAPDSYLNHWDGKPVTEVLDWLEKQDIHSELLRKAAAHDGLIDSNVAKDKEITDLKAKLALQSEDTQLLNSFGEWLKKIIVRLGVK